MESLDVNQSPLHSPPDVLVALKVFLQHVGNVGGDDLALARRSNAAERNKEGFGIVILN